ncbi:hypothetical protein A2U01_0111372 [Trifolium medium]|uniref:Uncharacterized protein n=1 Tax=Trifolium medium TaxID=97028 RepID=A0A392VRJ1_9FABA|nr:hypothetical protein [Trifolium medium]
MVLSLSLRVSVRVSAGDVVFATVAPTVLGCWLVMMKVGLKFFDGGG